MLAGQVEEESLILEVDGRDSVVLMLHVAFLLEIAQEAPAEQAHGEFSIAFRAVNFDLLKELSVLRGVLWDDLVD